MTAGVVAVTGATGFLGVHLIAALVAAGLRPRVLARRPVGRETWGDAPVEVVTGRLEEGDALDRLVAGAAAVVHAAGLIKAADRAAFLRVNAAGTRAVAEAARRRAADARFILVSSLAAREPQLSDYAASKRRGEEAAGAVYAGAADRLVIVRPPMIYGPGDRESLALFKAVAGPIAPRCGDGRIAAVHVADATAALARLAAGAGIAGLYALADPNPAGYAMRTLLAEAAAAVGHRPRFVPLPAAVLVAAGQASAFWGRLRGRPAMFTAGKAREILHPDWSVSPAELLPAEIHQARIGLADGFRQTVAWYRAAGWLG